MKARVAASSYTRLAGASRRTILQKIQSAAVGDIVLLLRRWTEDPIRDDEFLNFVRPLVQAEDPSVPIVSLDVEGPAEPVPAVDLDGPIRDALGHLGPEQLRHGDFERVVEAEVPHL